MFPTESTQAAALTLAVPATPPNQLGSLAVPTTPSDALSVPVDPGGREHGLPVDGRAAHLRTRRPSR